MAPETSQTDRCPVAAEIEDFLAGILDPHHMATLEAHLKECPTCQKEITRATADAGLLQQMQDANRLRLSHQDDDQAENQAHSRTAPVNIEGFTILDELHRGGSGVVYKARQHHPDRMVAIKLLRDDTSQPIRSQVRFEREIELAASLRHPNIVTVYQTGRASDRRYLVMEYVSGLRLNDHITRTQLSVHQNVELLLKICRGVCYAHQRGVIHRDLKPENILVDDDGEPRILDFGIAKNVQDVVSTKSALTMDGEFVGTIAYSSPEQVGSDPNQIDVRTDVYTLGVIGFQMLTGRLPYDIPEDLAGAVKCLSDTPPISPSTVAPGIDRDIETILLKCMSKEPERRYSSAESLARDLQHYLADQPIDARRDSRWYLLRTDLRRHRLAVGVTTAFLILAAAFGVTMTILYHQAERSADRATRTERFLLDTLASVNPWSLGPDVSMFDVLEHAERSIRTQLSNQPDVEAELRYTMGLTYASVRNDQAAKRHLQAAYDYYAATSNAQSERLGICLANLGRINNNEEDLRKAVRIFEEVHGQNSTEALLARLDLAAILAAGTPLNQHEAARLLRSTTERITAEFGGSHRYFARALQFRAYLTQHQQQPQQSLSLYQRALEIYSNQPVPDPYLCDLFERYSVLLADLGDFAGADNVLAQAIQTLPQSFGRSWRPGLQWQRARLWTNAGDFSKANTLFRESLAQQCLAAAYDRPLQAEKLLNMAARLSPSDKNQNAIAYPEVLLTVWGESMAEADNALSHTIDLAEFHLATNDHDTAAKLLAVAETISESATEPLLNHDERLASLHSRISENVKQQATVEDE